MAVPPKDAGGNVLPHDDPDIAPNEGLLRKIHPEYHLAEDPTSPSGFRLSSTAFTESSKSESLYGGMSVNLESFVPDPAALVGPEWGLLRLKAKSVRDKDYLVGSEPLPDDPTHANVWHKPAGKPNAPLKRIYKAADYEWVIEPPKLRAPAKENQ